MPIWDEIFGSNQYDSDTGYNQQQFNDPGWVGLGGETISNDQYVPGPDFFIPFGPDWEAPEPTYEGPEFDNFTSDIPNMMGELFPGWMQQWQKDDWMSKHLEYFTEYDYGLEDSINTMGLLKNQSILNDSTSAAQNYGSVMGGTGLTSGMGNIGYDDFLDSINNKITSNNVNIINDVNSVRSDWEAGFYDEWNRQLGLDTFGYEQVPEHCRGDNYYNEGCPGYEEFMGFDNTSGTDDDDWSPGQTGGTQYDFSGLLSDTFDTYICTELNKNGVVSKKEWFNMLKFKIKAAWTHPYEVYNYLSTVKELVDKINSKKINWKKPKYKKMFITNILKLEKQGKHDNAVKLYTDNVIKLSKEFKIDFTYSKKLFKPSFFDRAKSFCKLILNPKNLGFVYTYFKLKVGKNGN